MVERLEATLASIDQLERFRGHLYNWYDTRTLEPLGERYVSSVDSGNLAGHLLAVSSACREILDRPLPIDGAISGIADALTLVGAAALVDGDEGRSQTLTRRNLDEALADLALLHDGEASPATWAARLDDVAARTRTLADVAAVLTSERGGDPDGELVVWATAARSTVESHLKDVSRVADPDAVGRRRSRHAAARGCRRRHGRDPGCDAGTTAAGRRRPCPSTVRGDGLQLPVRPHEEALLDRLPRHRRHPRPELLRPAGLGVPAGELPRDRQGRRRRGSLVPARPGADARRSRLGADLLVGLDVRVPDARAGDAGAPAEPDGPDLPARGGPPDQLRAPRRASRGGSPSPRSTRGTSTRSTSTRASGSRVSGSSGASARTSWSRRTRPAWPPWSIRRRPSGTSSGCAAPAPRGRTGSARRSTTRPGGCPRARRWRPVMSYMAHHQGMLLVAIGNVLTGSTMVDRFHADPLVRATELLLQERMPRDVLVARPRAEEVKSGADVRDLVPPVLRRFTSPHDAVPRTHLLSNGRYAVMVTAAGSGYSRWGDLAVTRWREDVTRDAWGSFLFLRDRHSGAVWSVGHQPSGTEADTYEVEYAEDHAEFRRRDGPIATRLIIVVSSRARRRDPPGVRHQPRLAATRGRAHLVRRDRARPAGRRRRPPGLPEPVRPDRVRPRPQRARGHPPSPVRHGSPGLGGARRRGRGRAAGRHPVRDGSGALPRPRPAGRRRGRGDGRPSAVEHGRRGARSDLQPAPPDHPRGRRHSACDLLHRRGRVARGGPRPGRQVPRFGDVRAGRDAGVDPGAGPAPPPRDRPGRGLAVPAAGQPGHLLGPVAPASAGPARVEPSRRVGAVGARHLRRPPDRPRAGSTNRRTWTSSGSSSGPTSTGG